jgi:REP element-mobilizing transposase RayT
MVRYWRSRVTGGMFLFAVNFRDRRRSYRVEHVDALCHILHDVHKELAFTIDAMVLLPDH